jgi:hypothetical protein
MTFTLPSGQMLALGRARSSVLDDVRSLQFRLNNFVDRASLPVPPARITPPEDFAPRMFANDRLSDCTIAGCANFAMLAAVKAGRPVPEFTDDDVVARYSKVDGYNPADPSTDHGGIELEVLNDWRHDPFNGVDLLAFAWIDVHDLMLLRYAVQTLGGVYVGMQLPTSAQSQVGSLWDTVSGMVPGSWGGHCTIIDGFDYTLPVPELQHVTWGTHQRCTEAFWRACGDEAYAPLLDNALNMPGLNAAALQGELAKLGSIRG